MQRLVTHKQFFISVIYENACKNIRYFRYKLKLFTVYTFATFNTGEYYMYSYVIRRSIHFISPPDIEIITVIKLTHQLLPKNLACFSLAKKFATIPKFIIMFTRAQYMQYNQISNGTEIQHFSSCYFLLWNYLSPVLQITFMKQDVLLLIF